MSLPTKEATALSASWAAQDQAAREVSVLAQSAYEKSALTPTVDPISQQAQSKKGYRSGNRNQIWWNFVNDIHLFCSSKFVTIPAGQAPAIDPMKGEK